MGCGADVFVDQLSSLRGRHCLRAGEVRFWVPRDLSQLCRHAPPRFQRAAVLEKDSVFFLWVLELCDTVLVCSEDVFIEGGIGEGYCSLLVDVGALVIQYYCLW